MIVDISFAPEIGRADYPTIPDCATGKVGGFEDKEYGLSFVLLKNPQPLGESMEAIFYSVAVLRDGCLIFCASIEALDLRSLASALGVSVKELQAEHSTKSFYSKPHIIVYGNDEREDIGLYLGSMKDEDVFEFLKDVAYDSFDDGSDDVSSWLVE